MSIWEHAQVCEECNEMFFSKKGGCCGSCCDRLELVAGRVLIAELKRQLQAAERCALALEGLLPRSRECANDYELGEDGYYEWEDRAERALEEWRKTK